MVTLTDIIVEESGTYAIVVAYWIENSRAFQITIDDAEKIWVECKNSFNKDVLKRHIVTCQMEAGMHSIQFDNPHGDAPDLDEIRIYRCEAVEMEEYILLFDLETGRYSMTENGRTRICDAYAAARLGEELFKTAEYTEHTFTTERLEDAFGIGYIVKAVHQKEGCPVIEQRFQVYKDLHYFLTQTDIFWQDGSQISTNYIAPLYVDHSGGVENELDGKDYFLRIPYDNDCWVRYELNSINGSDTGYEVAAVLNEESGVALVMGSLSHDTWKTGITYSGSQNQIYNMQLYGGANGVLTRDQSPHGMVSGVKVSSPLMLIGAYRDWKDGMKEYADANALVTAPKSDMAGVPFGWNSWGVVQSDINLETAAGISDYIKEYFQEAWKQQEDDVIYTILDSYWDNMTDEQLVEFVKHCRKNGQKAGIYWAPFACWLSQENLSKTVVEGSDRVFYRDIILKKADGSQYGNDLDDAFPIDMTHPAAQKRADYFIDRFKKAGFSYIKLDFLVHGALEGRRYDSSVQTGTQAYNFAMKYVTDRLDGQMFINLSIAPTFPYQYANGKRIACDAYYSIHDTEYTLNGLTYGFWQKELYQFPDPDHLVVWGKDGGASEEEARSRITSGILLGTSFIAGDDFVAPTGDREDAKSRFQKLLINADIIKTAKTGKIFRPFLINHKKAASGIFTMSDEEVSYVAVLNYESHVQAGKLDLAQLFGVEGDTVVKELWSGEVQTLKDTILNWELAGKDAKVFRIGN